MDEIVEALDRLRETVARRPGFGCGTERSVTTLGPTLRCTTVEKDWRFESDLSPAFGGDKSAPPPGAHLRAALGACLAMGYRLRAAEQGVELTSVTVAVETDAQVIGMLDPASDAPAGYGAFRYHVEIESPAPAAAVDAVIAAGDELSPLLDVVGRANAIRRTSTVVRTPSSVEV